MSSNRFKGTAGWSRRGFIGSVASTSLVGFLSPLIARAQVSGATFDYYISPSGSDSNSGTASSPWALTALQSKSQIAGKRVGLLDGTYVVTNPGGLNSSNNDPLINLRYGGSAAAPTVIEAVNPRKAVITSNNGGAYPTGTFPLFRISGSYMQLRSLKFNRLSFAAIQVHGSEVLIDGCEITDIVASRNASYSSGDNCGGIIVGNDGTNLTIRNCLIGDIYNSGTSAGTNNGCVGPLYTYSNITIEYCTLYNSGHAIGPKARIGKVIGRFNHIRNMQQYAIRSMVDEDAAYSPLGGVFHNNLIVDCQNITGSDSPQSGMLPRSTDFYNNTCIFTHGLDRSRAGIIHWNGGSNTSGVGSDNRYFNNIFFVPSSQSTNYDGLLFFYSGTGNNATNRISTSDWNCWGQDASKFKMRDANASYSSKSAWQSATGFDANSVVGDPLFVNASGANPADFQLLSGSPCAKAGRAGGVASGAAVDMGAWGGASQIGHYFGITPRAPSDVSVT